MCRFLLRSIACIALATIGSYTASAEGNARPLTAQGLATLRNIQSFKISPDSQFAAFSLSQAHPDDNRYENGWYVLDIRSGRARLLTDAGDLLPFVVRGATTQLVEPHLSAWSPDSRWIAYLRRDRGRTQIWRIRRDGNTAQQLTHIEADARTLVYSRDGRRIFFETEKSGAQVADERMREGLVGFLYDERFSPFFSWLPLFPRDVDPDRPYEFSTRSQIAARQVWVYDFAAGREQPAGSEHLMEYEALTAPAYHTDKVTRIGTSVASAGGSIAWTEARDPNLQGVSPPMTIVALLAGSSDPIACTASYCTSVRLRGPWWRNKEELIFIRQEGLRLQDTALYAWRPAGRQPPRLILRTHNFLSGCAVAHNALLCMYEQPNYPNRIVSIDLDAGGLEVLYDPNPGFSTFELGSPPRRLPIKARSGVETYGYLILPPTHVEGQRLPLVLVTYNCAGFMRGGVGDEYPVYPLAAQGFAVFCYDLPDDFDQRARLEAAALVNWERGPDLNMRRRIEDTLDATIAQLDQMRIIDPSRVGVTGLSYGSEVVYFSLPHIPRLAAAIASSGGMGPSQYPFLGQLDRQMRRGFGLGPPSRTADHWNASSFSPHVARVHAPLLINVADREFVYSLDTVTALEDAQRSVEMFVFPDEYHVKWQSAHRLAIYNRNIDWMNFWLRGVESGLTADPQQYTRWRVMREQQCRLFGPNGTERKSRPRGEESLTDDELVPWYCRPGAVKH